MSDRVKVLVADDHPLFRTAVEDAVKGRPELQLVGAADNGLGALTEIRRLQPDVAVLDMRMPALSGDQVLRALNNESVRTRVLFLSTYTDCGAVYDLLAEGAAGYLDKGASSEEICNAITGVARGKTVLTDNIEGGVLQQIRLRGGDASTKLTPREHEVLKLIAKGLSAPDVGKRLYIETSTVKSHLQNTYGKLGVSERAAAVAEGMRRGLLQ